MDPGSGALLHRQLTRRQAECVALLAKGLSSKEIARELGISPSTVDNHIAAVMHQLNLPNRSALARFAASQHAVPQELDSQLIKFRPEQNSSFDHKLVEEAKEHSCPYCKMQKYFANTFLPSLVLALQCSIFLIIFFLILRNFVSLGF